MKTHLTVFFVPQLSTRYPRPVNKPARIFRRLTPSSSFIAERPILSTPIPAGQDLRRGIAGIRSAFSLSGNDHHCIIYSYNQMII